MRAEGGTPGKLLAIVLVLFALCATLGSGRSSHAAATRSAQGAQASFQWVTQHEDPVLWARVRAAFRQELLPDRRTANSVAYGYKYLLRIGAYQDSRLVIIGKRIKKDDPSEFDLFHTFTYDVGTSRKSPVAPSNSFWYWRFVALAQIDQSPAPDVVFTHDDCIECEGKSRLSSFNYSAAEKEWRLRVWPPDGTDLLIGGANKDEPQEIYEYVCLYTLSDFNGDALKDIAIWCRERATIHGGEKDAVALYTTQGGTSKKLEPTDALLTSIKQQLCARTPGSPLCASMK